MVLASFSETELDTPHTGTLGLGRVGRHPHGGRMMSGLQELKDVLDRWDESSIRDLKRGRTLNLFMDAARRVANGTEIRYCVKHESRMPYGATHCQIHEFPDDDPCDAGDYLLVDAALGTTEDD